MAQAAGYAERFWTEQARLVDWIRQPRVAVEEAPSRRLRWYPDGTLNTCYNALDRHVVHGHGDRPALLHVNVSTGSTQALSYAGLLERTAAFAGALRGVGVAPGERVLIDLPAGPEAVVAMLASARLGAVHVAVAGDQDADTLAQQVDRTRPAVVVTASGRGLDRCSHEPVSVIVGPGREAVADPGQAHVEWDVAMRAGAHDPAESVAVAATDPLYAVDHLVRDNGGHAVAMSWLLPHAYDVHAGQVWYATPALATRRGHEHVVYAPLLAGATTVLLDSSTPDPDTVARVVEAHSVDVLLASPALLTQVTAGEVARLRAAYSSEPLNDDVRRSTADRLGVPVRHVEVPVEVRDAGVLS